LSLLPLPAVIANARLLTDPAKRRAVLRLVRLDRPIGILLLLWPTLWALWFAADGAPPLGTLVIFLLGTALTRSAGCAVNDYADRHIDGGVARTRHRPLATGELAPRDALVIAAALMAIAFALVLLTNRLTVMLSFAALVLAVAYPFTKRITHFPQVVLGAAFAFSIPMAFAAVQDSVPPLAWGLFAATLVWAVAYDTLYAMADREDDLKLGVKSTAVLLGRHDLALVIGAHLTMLVALAVLGAQHGRGIGWFAGLTLALGLAWRQWRHAAEREPARCFEAFLQNNLLGAVVFAGLVLDMALTSFVASGA